MAATKNLTCQAPPARRPPTPPPWATRRRPRSYEEWATLRRWGKLPRWEESPAGYRLREARERAGLSQAALAERLGCTQQAVSQAERADSNPSVGFVAAWAEALGARLELELVWQDPRP